MRYANLTIMLIALALLPSSCGSPQDETVPQVLDSPKGVETSADPLQQWYAISVGVLEEMNFEQAMNLARQLAEQGVEKLEPIFAVLESSDRSPSAKVLAVISLSPFINESHFDRLLVMTKEDRDATTRGCAINLLALITTPAAEARIKELLNDPDTHVSKESALVLLRRDDSAAVEKAVSLWKDPATENKDRNEIVLAFPTARAKDNLFIYEDSICNTDIDFLARSHAINILGMLGNENSIAKLDACIASEQFPRVRELLESAKKAIEGRIGQPSQKQDPS